jgi:hypothetical protein
MTALVETSRKNTFILRDADVLLQGSQDPALLLESHAGVGSATEGKIN